MVIQRTHSNPNPGEPKPQQNRTRFQQINALKPTWENAKLLKT